MAAAIVLASSFAAADGSDADGDGVSDGVEDATERTVAALESGDGFSVSSRLGTGSLADQYELSYRAGTFVVWYTQSGGMSSSYVLEVRNLFWWADANGDDQIDQSEVLEPTQLGSEAFGESNVTRSTHIDEDGGPVIHFSMASKTLEVTLDVTMAQRFARLGNVTLAPTEAKMDITIQPLTSHPGASVAIELRMFTEDDVAFEAQSRDERNGYGPSGQAVSVTAGNGDRAASAFFSWANEASVAGTSIPVTFSSTSSDSNSNHSLWFAYPHGTMQASPQIVHQVSMGVQSVVHDVFESSLPDIRGDVLLYSVTFVTMAAALGSGSVLVRRHRSKTRRGET